MTGVKRVYQIVGLTLLLTLGVLIVIGLVLPRNYQAERSITVAAPAAAIYPLVSDFREWDSWAHWADDDPTLTREFAGAAREVGAIVRWRGERAGWGSLEIVESEPHQGITFIERVRSHEPTGTGRIDLEEDQGVTVVRWRDQGTLPPIIGGYFRGYMVETLEAHFAEGLRRLKARVEHQ